MKKIFVLGLLFVPWGASAENLDLESNMAVSVGGQTYAQFSDHDYFGNFCSGFTVTFPEPSNPGHTLTLEVPGFDIGVMKMGNDADVGKNFSSTSRIRRDQGTPKTVTFQSYGQVSPDFLHGVVLMTFNTTEFQIGTISAFGPLTTLSTEPLPSPSPAR